MHTEGAIGADVVAAGVVARRRLYDEALVALLARGAGADVRLVDPARPGEPADADIGVLYVHAVGPGLADACAEARARWPGVDLVAVGSDGDCGADGVLSTEEAAGLVGRRPAIERRGAGELTARDHEVLGLLRRGAGTMQIAHELAMAPSAARATIQRLLDRLGARSRVEAVALAQLAAAGRAAARPRPTAPPALEDGAPIRVALRCADALAALLLEEALPDDDVVVVDAAAGPAAATPAPPVEPADVVLVDLDLPGGAARHVVAATKHVAGTRALVVGDGVDQGDLRALLEAGVDGFVLSGDGLDAARAAVRAVAGGEPAVPPALLGTLLRSLVERHRDEDAAIERYIRLSLQARAVLALLAEGADHRAIAGRLVVSPHTARTHIQNVLRKLDVHSRLEAVALADRFDLLTRFPPDPR